MASAAIPLETFGYMQAGTQCEMVCLGHSQWIVDISLCSYCGVRGKLSAASRAARNHEENLVGRIIYYVVLLFKCECVCVCVTA